MIFHKLPPTKELTVKYVRRFAFIPVNIEERRIVWLQWYEVKYRFESTDYNEDYFSEQDISNKWPNSVSFGYYIGGAFWNLKYKYLPGERDKYKSVWDNYLQDHESIP